MMAGTRRANRSSVRARFPKTFVVVGVVVPALVAGACRKSSEEQQREAQKATEEAEQQASQTTITSAEIGPNGSNAEDTEEARQDAQEARDRALREHAEAITTARNEQLEYRGKLQSALDALDAKRRDAKKRGPVHVKAIDGKRELLRHDLDVLDRTTDAEWASLKAKIDRDLKDHAGASAHGSDSGAEGEGK
jgi:hypothetical protein